MKKKYSCAFVIFIIMLFIYFNFNNSYGIKTADNYMKEIPKNATLLENNHKTKGKAYILENKDKTFIYILYHKDMTSLDKEVLSVKRKSDTLKIKINLNLNNSKRNGNANISSFGEQIIRIETDKKINHVVLEEKKKEANFLIHFLLKFLKP
jgi:hypothetical protein